VNRIDRLFNIILLLQARRRVRAADLAETFGVTERTIYRDMAALNEMGVPILSLPGEGYELMEGFYLPPLVFTPEEASALALGASMLAASGNYTHEAARALQKIVAVLPNRTREQVEQQTRIINFMMTTGQFDLQNPYLLDLQKAILEQRVVHIRYHSLYRDETTEREIEPYNLTFAEGVWYINSFTAQGFRTFRLDRVEALRVLSKSFEPRDRRTEETEQPTVIVRARFVERSVRWVRERQHYAFQYEQPEPGFVVMTYAVQRLSEIKNWLLGWGAQVEILEPPDLRAEIREEACRLLDLLT
jgi:predicted DNA-binding transcriptional regulator YafY